STGLGAVFLLRLTHSLTLLFLGICAEGLALLRSLFNGFCTIAHLPFRSGDPEADDAAEKPFTLDGRVSAGRRNRATRGPVPRVEDDEPDEEDNREVGEVKILRRGGPEKKKSEKKRSDKRKQPQEEFELPSVEFLVRGEVSASSAPKDKE